MYKTLVKIISIIMITVLITATFTSVPTSAKTVQEEINDLEAESKRLEAEINKLKNEVKEQQKLKKTVEQKMAVVQQQINACNKQINSINAKISANKEKIKKIDDKIEADKLSFKKRLRAIYMSNTGSNIQILLGAKDFSEFLQLSQMTASVSAHDKKMIENLVTEIKKIEEMQKENEKLLEDQVAIKATIAEKQKELAAEDKRIQNIINSKNYDKSKLEEDNKEVEKMLQAELDKIANSSGGSSGNNVVYDGGAFLWPTPTINKISSYYGTRWGKLHKGIDIANGTWGAKIVAIADGVVETYQNGCTHNSRKNPLYTCCSYGGGYGKYITINHGKKDGKYYVAYYAHMSSIAVGKGAKVKKGDIVGYVGSTGRSTGPHLHFGICLQTRNSSGTVTSTTWVDPMNYYTKVG